MAGCEAHSHSQNSHVCGYIIASSNQLPIFNATHKQINEPTNKRTDWKRLNILRIVYMFCMTYVMCSGIIMHVYNKWPFYELHSKYFIEELFQCFL